MVPPSRCSHVARRAHEALSVGVLISNHHVCSQKNKSHNTIKHSDMISNWKSPNASIKKIRLFITLVLTMMMMVTMLLFFASSSPSARLFVSPSKSGDGAKTSSSKSSGFVLCKDDDVMAQDGCFRFRKGTLTDPWKKEREMQTMDPDDLIRNEQLVEKIREGEMKQRKPTSRDVEDMRRARDAFDRVRRFGAEGERGKASEVEDESFE